MTPPSIGRTTWAFAAGMIPEDSTGPEPEFTSRNVLCFLNATSEPACAQLTVHHDDKDPVGSYEVRIPAGRVRHVRLNDLIDPEAVPLGSPFGIVMVSDVPLVVELTHVDTRRGTLSVSTTSGLPGGS